MRHIYLPFLFVLLFASCAKNRYITEETVALTRTHEKVAVLPVDVFTTGRLPKNLSEAEIKEIELAESEYFQDIILASIQRNTRRGKTPYWVDFMSNQETTKLLKQQGISIEQSFELPPSQLAKLLGVDAVVRADVKKTRYMSEEASAIISVAQRAVWALSDGPVFGLPRIATTTNDVDLRLDLVNAEDGVALYHRNIDLSIDYRNTTDDAVERLSNKLGRFFPYKEHKLAKIKTYDR
ncbi:MAG: hypothetical protein KTR13_00905 [Saprospiraceae bacterium]|nr:hypothetical protein [Saprospiraceae bacterium]